MALGKMALGKMAGWVKWRRVKWHWVKWNWVNCHVTRLTTTRQINNKNKHLIFVVFENNRKHLKRTIKTKMFLEKWSKDYTVYNEKAAPSSICPVQKHL